MSFPPTFWLFQGIGSDVKLNLLSPFGFFPGWDEELYIDVDIGVNSLGFCLYGSSFFVGWGAIYWYWHARLCCDRREDAGQKHWRSRGRRLPQIQGLHHLHVHSLDGYQAPKYIYAIAYVSRQWCSESLDRENPTHRIFLFCFFPFFGTCIVLTPPVFKL